MKEEEEEILDPGHKAVSDSLDQQKKISPKSTVPFMRPSDLPTDYYPKEDSEGPKS